MTIRLATSDCNFVFVLLRVSDVNREPALFAVVCGMEKIGVLAVNVEQVLEHAEHQPRDGKDFSEQRA